MALSIRLYRPDSHPFDRLKNDIIHPNLAAFKPPSNQIPAAQPYHEQVSISRAQRCQHSVLKALPAITSDNLPVSTSDSPETRHSEGALIGLRLTTARGDRSGLSVGQAGILVAILGDTPLVQRISRKYATDSNSAEMLTDGSGTVGSSSFLGSGDGIFNEGSEDEVWIASKNIGRVQSLWLAPESGTWRPSHVTLLVVPLPSDQPSDISPDTSLSGTVYQFNNGSGALATEGQALELSPTAVTDNLAVCLGSQEEMKAPEVVSGLEGFRGPLSKSRGQVKSVKVNSEAREASMADYENLKRLILLSMSALVCTGTVVSYSLAGIEPSRGFLLGGLLGISYCLWLQKRVDSLAPHRSSDSADAHLLHQFDSLVKDFFDAVDKEIKSNEVNSNKQESTKVDAIASDEPTEGSEPKKDHLAEDLVLFFVPWCLKFRRLLPTNLKQKFAELADVYAELEELRKAERRAIVVAMSVYKANDELEKELDKFSEKYSNAEDSKASLAGSIQMAAFKFRMSQIKADASELKSERKKILQEHEEVSRRATKIERGIVRELGGEVVLGSLRSVVREVSGWGPVGYVSRAFLTVVLVWVVWNSGVNGEVTPRELLFGAAGFFCYKVSVAFVALWLSFDEERKRSGAFGDDDLL